MNTHTSSLSFGLILLCTCLNTISAVVLDDFLSPDSVVNYMGFDDNDNEGVALRWELDGAALRTDGGVQLGFRTGGFFWTGGERLHPGDAVMVDVRLSNFNRGIGLRFARQPFGRALTQEDPTTADVSEEDLNQSQWVLLYRLKREAPFQIITGSGRGIIPADSRGIALVDGAQPEMSDWITLVVQRESGTRQNRLRWSFEGGFFAGHTGVFIVPGLSADEPLYFALNQLLNSRHMRFANLRYLSASN